jgi:TPR repeat protein
VQAAFYLGLMHAEKDTPLHDDAEALRWSRVAARGGHALAYCNVALMTLTGRGQPADPAQAVAMLETAIGQRNVYAAELLAEWYSSGEHFQPALERARDLLLQALEQGSVKAACHLVALRVQGNDWAVDWARVRAMLQPSDPRANESSGLDPELAALAQLALGQMTAAGLDRDAGDGDNDEKAVDIIGHELAALPYFRRAAEAGVADAQAWMGDHLHLHGQSAADALAARHWYRSAARQGHVDALVALAELPHPAGPSEADDDKELFGLLLDAASKGHVPAQRHVAQCYLEGRGCRPYAAAAVRWLERCAGAGDAESQYLLGLCHRHGRGVRADIALARLWIERAAAQDHPQAQRWLDERRKLYLSAAKEPVTRPAVSAS